MTTKVQGSNGIEFPDSSVQSSAAYTKAQSDGPAFRAINGTNQGVAAGVFVKATLGSEDFDTANCFSGGTFTPNVAGYYQVSCVIHHSCTGTLTAATTQIRKNGAVIASAGPMQGTADGLVGPSTLVYMNGTTDFLELFGYQTGGTNNLFANGLTWMSAFLARRA